MVFSNLIITLNYKIKSYKKARNSCVFFNISKKLIHFPCRLLGGVFDDRQDFGADDTGTHRDLNLVPHLHIVGSAGDFAVDRAMLRVAQLVRDGAAFDEPGDFQIFV